MTSPVPATFSAVTNFSVAVTATNPLDIGSVTASLSDQFGAALTIGALAGQANVGWWDYRTLAASTSEQLNLVGSLVGPFGSAVTFARVKVLIVSAAVGNTNNVLVGGAVSDEVPTFFGNQNDIAIVRPGATVSWIAGAADSIGYAVTPATGNLLQVANSGSGTPISYSIIILGCST